MQPQHEFEIYERVRSTLKIYPDRVKLYVYNEPILQRIEGYEERERTNNRGRGFVDSNQPSSAMVDSVRRSKTRISDITLCNNFDLFVTFTFSPSKVNRQSPIECKTKMAGWLKRQNERNGKFPYLIVPEFHKDGKSLHFHALFSNYTGKLTHTDHKINGRTTYNIKSYALGYSTAVKIDDIDKVSNYVKKYITKDMPLFRSKHRYWCSKDLIRPIKVRNPDLLYYDLADLPFDHDNKYQTDNLTVYTKMLTVASTN